MELKKPLRKPVEPNEFVRVLQRVGLLPDSDFITGVYISVDPHNFVTIQVSMGADDRIYDIAPELVKDGS